MLVSFSSKNPGSGDLGYIRDIAGYLKTASTRVAEWGASVRSCGAQVAESWSGDAHERWESHLLGQAVSMDVLAVQWATLDTAFTTYVAAVEGIYQSGETYRSTIDSYLTTAASESIDARFIETCAFGQGSVAVGRQMCVILTAPLMAGATDDEFRAKQTKASDLEVLINAEVDRFWALENERDAANLALVTAIGNNFPAGWAELKGSFLPGTDPATMLPAVPAEFYGYDEIVPDRGDAGSGDGEMAPAEVAAWWAGLSPTSQSLMIQMDPARIGGLEGVPAAVRDQVNRDRMADLRQQLVTRRNELSLFERNVSRRAESDALNEKIDAIDATAKVLAKGNRQLLLLDLESHADARVVVAVGDVDTAKHVGILVGGTSTNVENGLEGMDRDAQNLQEQALAIGKIRSDDVAIITWIDYTAPERLTDAWDPSYAGDGAPDLVAFTQGLTATNMHGVDLDVTVGGHSYGSITSSEAARHLGSQIDNLVVYGAPGISFPPDTDVNKYWMANDNDPIRAIVNLGWYKYQPNTKDGWVEFDTDAIVFDGIPLIAGNKHDYLDQETTTQHNLAAVIVGRLDKVVLYDGE